MYTVHIFYEKQKSCGVFSVCYKQNLFASVYVKVTLGTMLSGNVSYLSPIDMHGMCIR